MANRGNEGRMPAEQGSRDRDELMDDPTRRSEEDVRGIGETGEIDEEFEDTEDMEDEEEEEEEEEEGGF